MAIIRDHKHQWIYRGPWRLSTCGLCGRRIIEHLSWGIDLANKLGGSPFDYVDKS